MARRVRLPAAEDLFPSTHNAHGTSNGRTNGTANGSGQPAPKQRMVRPSGRVRHDEKMTVYVTSEELVELEQARLALRSRHGVAVDRGRMVREAVALVLADLEHRGAESALVRRLTED